MKTNSISAGLAVCARTITTTRHLLLRRAWLWTGFLAFATIVFAPQPAQAAVTEAWVQRYSHVVSAANDRAVKVVRDAAGDIIVTGTTAGGFPGVDMLTIKYTGADGSVLWQQRYNSPANGQDRPSALAVDGSGNVVVAGSSRDWTDEGLYTAKYAASDGALLWERRYSGSNWNNRQIALAVDGSGNVVVTGTSGHETTSDCYTAKYAAADGALLWERLYNGPANGYDQTDALAVDRNGNVVVAGRSSNGPNVDYYTAKYAAANGALLWEKRYNSPENGLDFAKAVAVDGSGNVVVTGNSGFYPNYDYYTVSYAAADGALLWEKRFNGRGWVGDSSRCLALGPKGMMAVSGSSAGDFTTVVYREVPTVSINLVLTGVRLRVTGVPGRSYNSERAPATTGPWISINTQTAPASGLFEFLDTLPHPGSGFYRIVQL